MGEGNGRAGMMMRGVGLGGGNGSQVFILVSMGECGLIMAPESYSGYLRLEVCCGGYKVLFFFLRCFKFCARTVICWNV